MNVLFYTSFEVSPIKGGTERITATIATELQRTYGIKCYSIYKTTIPVEFERTPFTASMQIPMGKMFEISLYNFIKEYDIDIIVNQGAFELATSMRHVLDRFNGKYLITVHHFNPGGEEHFFNLHHTFYQLKKETGCWKNMIKLLSYPVLKYLKKRNLHKAYHEAYLNSDRIVLLSDKFREDFRKYAHLDETDKISSIHNALSFDSFFDMADYSKKRKEVLIVSRLDEVQKRISLALRVWKLVEQHPQLNDWRLVIVGHGDEYEASYKQFVRKEGLKHVVFEGAQKPESYYKDALLFMLTSAYEGWGLTLTEAQQYGVVPLAFYSYASVTDIITDGQNGYLIPDGDISLYAKQLMNLMQNDSLRKRLAANSIETSKRFSIDNICKDWVMLFNDLM